MKIRLDVSSESSAKDSHKKSSLFSSKDKSQELKCRLLQYSFGTFRVKCWYRDFSRGIQTEISNSIPDEISNSPEIFSLSIIVTTNLKLTFRAVPKFQVIYE